MRLPAREAAVLIGCVAPNPARTRDRDDDKSTDDPLGRGKRRPGRLGQLVFGQHHCFVGRHCKQRWGGPMWDPQHAIVMLG